MKVKETRLKYYTKKRASSSLPLDIVTKKMTKTEIKDKNRPQKQGLSCQIGLLLIMKPSWDRDHKILKSWQMIILSKVRLLISIHQEMALEKLHLRSMKL